MSNNKVKAMEYLWIGIAILSLGTGIHKTINHGFDDSWLFYIFALVAVLMWFLRKKMRENEDK